MIDSKYDRQLRLWGVDAQKRMHNARILFLGFNGLASETAKILALAGVNHITIVDDRDSLDLDMNCNLFCGRSGDEKTNRQQEITSKLNWLNPKGSYQCLSEPFLSKDGDYFKDFDLVCVSELIPTSEIIRINDECRKHNIKFYAQMDFGLFGFIFNDLGQEYKFTHEEPKPEPNQTLEIIDDLDTDSIEVNENDSDESSDEKEKTKKKRKLNTPEVTKIKKEAQLEKREMITTEKILNYCTFRDMINTQNRSFSPAINPALILSMAMYRFFDTHKRKPNYSGDGLLFINELDYESLMKIVDEILIETKLESHMKKKLSLDWEEFLVGGWAALTSIVGGLSGQDILRAVSHKFIPILNTFAFDGSNLKGTVEKVM